MAKRNKSGLSFNLKINNPFKKRRRIRRKKKKLTWGLIILVILIIYSYPDVFKDIFIYLIFAAVGCIVIYALIKIFKRRKLRNSDISEIDKMNGRDFEFFLGELFKSRGYAITVTQSSGDYGADLIINKEGKKIVVQAKRYTQNVGLDAVQQAFTATSYYDTSEAWVVTNSDFTKAAYSLASSCGVKLINRDELIKMTSLLNKASKILLK